MRVRRKRLTASDVVMLEQAGWVKDKRFRALLKDAGLVQNYIPGDSPAGHPRNVSFVPSWALRMCEQFAKDMHHDARVEALTTMGQQLIPLAVRIAQEGLGRVLAQGYDPREVIAMLRGKGEGI